MSHGNFGFRCGRNISADGERSGERRWPTGDRPAGTRLRGVLRTRAQCRQGKAPRDPYEGKPHVRFDEGLLETEPRNGLRHRHDGESRRSTEIPVSTANVLDKLPRSLLGKAKQALHDIYLAESYHAATEAFERFVKLSEKKFPKAVSCLKRDCDALLAFYDLPADHWGHL